MICHFLKKRPSKRSMNNKRPDKFLKKSEVSWRLRKFEKRYPGSKFPREGLTLYPSDVDMVNRCVCCVFKAVSRLPYSSVSRERRQYHAVLPSHFFGL